MIHENDIPEYALQPAKAPKTVPAEAIYNTQNIVCPAEKQTVLYQFEEDILVPDTKPDMLEILLMDASADIMPAEKKISPRTDDLLNITGTILLQTIYNPEGDGQEPVSITSKIPYKYQWNLSPVNQSDGIFGCHVKNLEFMIINERKFRVKVTLEFEGRLFCRQEFQFFDSLKEDVLETKRVQTAVTGLTLVKKDETVIDETFSCKDSAAEPVSILKQDFVITENYRQVTTEKVVINGFIFCSLLYTAAETGSSEGEDHSSFHPSVLQHNHRIEFTQFIPIEKEYRTKNWSTVKTRFTNKDLQVSIVHSEENPEKTSFQIKGCIQTRAELYQLRTQEAVIDAYHREKDFRFLIKKLPVSNITDSSVSETSIREIINLPEGCKASDAIYAAGTVQNCQCVCERGKIIITGSTSCCALWKDTENGFHAERISPDFRSTVDMEGCRPELTANCRPTIKTAWAEMINEKQIELNCSVLLCIDLYEEGEIVLLEQPSFGERPAEKEYPMAVVRLQKGETLWDLAKRYRTTEKSIETANGLEGPPKAGQRLLIIR